MAVDSHRQRDQRMGEMSSLKKRGATAITNPFSEARLIELYNREGKSPREIGILAGELLGRGLPVSPPAVLRWLVKTGFPLRTPADSRKLFAKLHPECWQKSLPKAQEISRDRSKTKPGIKAFSTVTTSSRRKNQKKFTEYKIRQAAETRVCCLAGCGIEITKPRCKFHSPVDRTYCTRNHANVAQGFIRQIERAKAYAKKRADDAYFKIMGVRRGDQGDQD